MIAASLKFNVHGLYAGFLLPAVYYKLPSFGSRSVVLSVAWLCFELRARIGADA